MPHKLTDTQGTLPPPPPSDRSTGRLQWHFAPIEPALQQAIRDIPWDNLGGFAHAELVKVAENRDVWRIDLPAKTIYAKCYRSNGLGKRILESVRGLAAKREWRALRQASRLGVRAPDPLGYARQRHGTSGSYSAVLVTAAMPADAQSLEEAWIQATSLPEPQARLRKHQLTEALAELIAKAHAGGLFHRDLHVGNVLLYKNGHGPTAAMIDLHNARLSRKTTIRGVLGNLVQLNQWFARHASRTDRLRFLKVYCQRLRGQLALPEQASQLYGHKAFARHVLKQSHRYAASLYRKRDRRILRKNKYFTTLALPDGWSGRLTLDVKHGRPYHHALTSLPSKADWRQMLAEPLALAEPDGARLLKQGRRQRVLLTDLRFGQADWPVIVKYRQDEMSPLLARLLRRDSLRREFVTGWQCLHRELPVALPLGILTRRTGGRTESILLTEFIPDSRDLDTFTRLQLAEMDPDRALPVKRQICGQLASALRRMWRCGLAHRDLKASNIRVQTPGGDLSKLRIVLIDVDGIRRSRLSPYRAVLRSLARLDASFAHCRTITRTDRLRLLLAVLREMDHGQPDWRRAWRQIAPLSLRDQAVVARTMPWLGPIPSTAGAG